MKTAVFSDIHGNVYALEAMLCQLEGAGVGQFIFCGDIMGYFPWQEEAMEYFLQLPNLYAVLGNHDSYYIGTARDSKERMGYADRYGKSYQKELGSRKKSYIEGLPLSIELCQEGKRILVVHGSLGNPLEGRVYPDTEVEEPAYTQYDIVISGHTHYQMCRKIKDTVLLNPGSLGQPRDDKGYSYCLMDVEKGEYIFRTVSVDSQKIIARLAENGERKELIKYMKRKMEVVM